MTERNRHPSRREAIRAGIAAGVGLTLGHVPLSAQLRRLAAQQELPLITKRIPATGEELPAVGIGTNRFSTNPETRAQLCDVLRNLSRIGGKVVDTARGYGTSEVVIGDCIREIGNRDQLFLATKYSLGRGQADAAQAEMRSGLEEAFTRLQTPMIDLMMVHNLGGTDPLMPLMKELKQAGRFRYLGVSTSSDSQYPALMELMRREPLDFIEVDYSVGNRSAERDILPLAQERGMAVLINVPFGGRSATVLQTVGNRPVPDWAREFDATTWPQVFLKYLVAHPAVTAVIPGTTRVEHLVDNHAAARGRLPDAAMRRRIEELYDSLNG